MVGVIWAGGLCVGRKGWGVGREGQLAVRACIPVSHMLCWGRGWGTFVRHLTAD